MSRADPSHSDLAYIGLGGNLGDARRTLEQALDALRATPGVRVLRVSGFYCTAPVDAAGPNFINAVAEVHTRLTALAMLDALQTIETSHHRQRPYRNAPRTLDLDLLWHHDQAMHTERLTLPHPRMHERAFVLAPLQELRPGWRLPQGNLSDLLARCAAQPIRRLA